MKTPRIKNSTTKWLQRMKYSADFTSLIKKKLLATKKKLKIFTNIIMGIKTNRLDRLKTFFVIKIHKKSFRTRLTNLINKQYIKLNEVPYSCTERFLMNFYT